MQQLQLDEFLRSLKQNIDMPHSLLLGAGASNPLPLTMALFKS